MNVIKGFANTLADPQYFFVLAILLLVVLVWKRQLLATNGVGYGVLGFLTLFFVFGVFDANFRLIVTKPDNVPIVGLDRKSTRLNSSHIQKSRMPSSA